MSILPFVLAQVENKTRQVRIELRYATPLLCAAALLVIHLAGASSITAILLVVALTITAISVFWAWQMAQHVHAERRLAARWVQAGDTLEERFTLQNDSFLPVLWAEIADYSNVPGYSASTVRAVDGHSQIHWTYSGVATRRGEFHLGPWSVETGDPFGMFAVHIRYDQARPLLVYPPIAHLPFPSLPRGASPGAFCINRASPAPTVNAAQVRAYQVGDSFRHIHWPSTARHNELMVKLFDQEASANVWLMLDADPAVQSGEGNSSTEEVGVLVAASLADELLREGRAVGLICAGQAGKLSYLAPARSAGHLWTILGALARLPTANDRHALTGLPLARALNEIARALRGGSSLLIITPAAEAEWGPVLAHLAWRQILPTVILIDPAPAGRPAREHLRRLLAAQGIAAQAVRCDAALPVRPLLGKTRRWEFKTLATGRVVATMESVR